MENANDADVREGPFIFEGRRRLVIKRRELEQRETRGRVLALTVRVPTDGRTKCHKKEKMPRSKWNK